MPTTRLRLLGRPEVVHADGVSALPVERRCRVLVVLALRRGWVGRAELAALLWPDRKAELGLANVRKALHLAHELGWADALETEGHAVRFQVPTDVRDFELAQQEGRVADALACGGAVLLDGWDDLANPAWSEWLDAQRAAHAQRWQRATRARLGQLSPADAAGFARQLLETDPLDEDAIVALLAAQDGSAPPEQQHEAYRRYADRLRDELGVEPSLRVRARLAGRTPAPPAAADPGDGFVGRTHELQELSALLARPECRLLSIVGPGGIGKSSLAKQALRRLAPLAGGDTLWIPLDDLGGVEPVVARLAAELQLVPGPAQDPLQAVCRALAARRVHLVFDNGEHLAGLPHLVDRLLADVPTLTVITTSRARLGVKGEWLMPLQGLPADDAARLFGIAALAMQPGFDAVRDRDAIQRVVALVGGLPLALLLAAQWCRLWPVAQIAAEIEHSLDVLDTGDDGEERPEHRSVRATFEPSWRWLAPREQAALSELTVFVGGFERDAARDIAGATWPLLAALVDKSLLQVDDGRCALHPLVRRFAAERLAPERAATAWRRHGEYFHRLLAQSAGAVELGDRAALDHIGRELENCRQAWRWAVATGAHAALAASTLPLMRFFELRGRTAEGVALLSELPPDDRGDAAALAAQASVGAAVAHLLFRMYRLDDAAERARRAIKQARTAGPRPALLMGLQVLANCQFMRGRTAEAMRIFEQSLRQAQAAGDRLGIATAIGGLAMVEARLGHMERSRERMVDVLALHRELGNWHRIPTIQNNLSALHAGRGEWEESRRFALEGLAASQAHGIAQVRPHLLLNLASAQFALGETEAAARTVQQALADAREMSNRAAETTALMHAVRIAVRQGRCHEARERLHEAVVVSAGLQGSAVQLDIVFAYAKILAAEGRAADAAGLLRYFVARDDTEPVERTEARGLLAGLASDAPAPALDLADLVRRTIAELQASSGPMQPAPAHPA